MSDVTVLDKADRKNEGENENEDEDGLNGAHQRKSAPPYGRVMPSPQSGRIARASCSRYWNSMNPPAC